MSKKYRICIAQEECKGCKRCIPACPEKLLTLSGKVNHQGYFPVCVEQPKQCIGCGSCYLQCPEPGAITIYQEEA